MNANEKIDYIVNNYDDLYEEMKDDFDGSIAEQSGIKLPQKETQMATCLVYYYYNKNTIIKKQEFEELCFRKLGKKGDIQDVRHLGAQRGFAIKNQRREFNGELLKKGEYVFEGFDKTHPSYAADRRSVSISGFDWEEKKRYYRYKCAHCGDLEGEESQKNPGETVQLEKGHRDPRKGMTADNIIPLCRYCNGCYRDSVIFNEKGVLTGIIIKGVGLKIGTWEKI